MSTHKFDDIYKKPEDEQEEVDLPKADESEGAGIADLFKVESNVTLTDYDFLCSQR